MPGQRFYSWQRVAAYALLFAIALANCGCLVVAAGAAGGAAAGYAYMRGRVYETYNANLNDTWNASQTALRELGMVVVSEDKIKGTIESHAADGERIRLSLDTVASKIPAEGEVTRVSVRVATFGDKPLSDRILDQISVHLAPVGAVPQAAQNTQAVAPASGIVQTGAQTQAPPLAPATPQTAPPPLSPEPVPVRK